MKLFGRGKGIQSPEFREKKLRERRLKAILIIFAASILIGGTTYIFRQPQFLIESVRVEGLAVTPVEEVLSVVNENLSGKYLGILPRSNSSLIPKKAIERNLLRSIPRLKSVSLSVEDSKVVKVQAVERSPEAQYCGDITELNSPKECFFLDEEGFIFAESPAFSGDVYFIFLSEPALLDPLGKKLMQSGDFKETLSFLESLPALGVHPRAFKISGEEFHLILPNGGFIRWESSSGLLSIYENLSALLSDSKVVTEKNFLDRILYIDMRFGNKIFYKFRD